MPETLVKFAATCDAGWFFQSESLDAAIDAAVNEYDGMLTRVEEWTYELQPDGWHKPVAKKVVWNSLGS